MMRTLTIAVFLACAGLCAPAVAQGRPDAVDSALASTTFASLAPGMLAHPQNAVLLRRATGAVVTAVRSGLVLLDVRTPRADTCIYVKFGSDGMPRLRWLTRF